MSGSPLILQPPSWKSRWWKRQSWTKLPSSVGPLGQWSIWWVVGAALPPAAGEATAAVPEADLAVEPRRHGAGRVPHSERTTELVVVHERDPAVAGETPKRLRRDGVTALELRGPVAGEHDRLGVDHDGGPVRVGVGRDRRGGELDEGVGGGLLGGPVEPVGALGLDRGPAPDRLFDHGADLGGEVTGDPQRGEIETPGQLETPPPVSLVGLLRGDGAPPASE